MVYLSARFLKYSLLLCVIALATIIPGSPVWGEEPLPKIRIGLYENAPKIYLDEDGKPAGFFPDLIHYLSIKLKFEPVYVPVSWPGGMDMLESGAIDMMPDITLTPERLSKFHYNEIAILENWASLYIHEDMEPSYYTLQDIKGKTVAVLRDDSNFEALKEELGKDTSHVTFEEFTAYTDVFKAIEEKTCDMGLVSYYFGIYRKDDFDVRQLQMVINPNTVHLAVKDPELSPLIYQIDRELISLKQDDESVYYKLIDEWLSTNNYFKFPRWLSWMLAGLVVMLLFLLITISALQMKLRKSKTELSHINTELKQNIEKKTRIEENLRARNKELAKTNEAMDQLIYQVSHNLRAPIASVLGLINVLRLEIPVDNLPGMPVQKMENSMHNLDTIIGDILDYYQNNRTGITQNEIDLEQMVQGIFNSMAHLHAANRVDLQIQVEQHAPFYSDRRRLKSILHNLISNAIKYYDTQKDANFVKVEATITGEHAIIQVQDNGIGIPDDQHEKVFSMFYRATTLANGAGLGLYIIRETLEKLNGNIDMTSAAGEGTTFVVTIPNLLGKQALTAGASA